MELNDWIKEVQIEDIPAGYQDLARAVGVEAFVRLVFAVGGTTLYIPKTDSIIHDARDRFIIREFNGSNHKELALKYDVTDSWVRRIINRHLLEQSQLKLWEQASGE